MNKGKNKRYWLLGVTGVFLALVIAGGMFLGNYARATQEALNALLAPPEGVELREVQGSFYAFVPENPTAGFIFYPGALVDEKAYAPMMARLAENGLLCVVLQMPVHLAVLNTNAADGIAARFPEADCWYIGGHSLGGAIASVYAAKHSKDFHGLILLASYAAADLKDTGLQVLSLAGSEDGVLNWDKYEESKGLLPPNAREVILTGGNHAQFGWYGEQRGDKIATISAEEQQQLTVDAIIRQVSLGE